MRAELPPKYYLSHARELFNYLHEQCGHLLDGDHKLYLESFDGLSDDAQCLLVRLLTRKHNFVKIATLKYQEITNTQDALSELHACGFISAPKRSDWQHLAPLMTKPELLTVLRESDIHFKASSAKSVILNCAVEELKPAKLNMSLISRWYVAKRRQTCVEYLFFLFFGDLRNRFQKFAMRDLGVLKVRDSAGAQTARYDDKRTAVTAFSLQRLHKQFRQSPEEVFENAASYALTQESCANFADPARDKLLLELGDYAAEQQPDRAIQLWQQSNEPKAIERWIRHAYKHHDKAELQQNLEKLRASEQLASSSRLFVEDFYSRKYMGKRTSIYTDLLRATDRVVPLDEAYLNDVEAGVMASYEQVDIALFTENKLWRALFAFTFWEILFSRQHNEFDRLPAPLKHNRFYQDHAEQVEQCLAATADRQQFVLRCAKLATQHYGYPTGLFRWRADLMDMLLPCVNHAPEGAIANTLRRMAKNYQHAKDGYPDIMVVEAGQLRFEEIKAPGDVLRPNQLVSIQRLREAGFSVDITQVEWATNPDQIYAVVDIETTGGRKGGNAITEIAVVRVQNGEIISEWSTLLNPQRPIPRHITQLTGIDNAMVSNAPLFGDIANELNRQLDKAIFVAHNVGFDYGFIKAAYESIGQGFRKPKFCTVSNSRKTFPGLKSYSLGNLTQAFDIDLKNHHRALADAQATAHLLRLIQSENHRKRQLDSIQETA